MERLLNSLACMRAPQFFDRRYVHCIENSALCGLQCTDERGCRAVFCRFWVNWERMWR